MPRPLHVFLCHASQDKPAVRELYNALKSEEWIDPWLDKAKILAGQDWEIVIDKAVEASDVVIVCLSNRSVTKEGFVQKEIRYAYDNALEKPEDTIFLIPLRLDNCSVPRKLKPFHWVDYFGAEKADAYSNLLEALKLRYEQKLYLEEAELGIAENSVLEKEKRDAFERVAREKVRREHMQWEFAQKAVREKAQRDAKQEARQKKPAANLLSITRGLGFLFFIGIFLVAIFLGVKWLSPPVAPTITESSTITETPTQAPIVLPVATALPVATEVSSLGLGSTMISEKDGMTLVYVPAGEFTMGSNQGDPDEKPVHKVNLEAFWIDQTEVTNKMYSSCVAAGACKEPAHVGSATHSRYYGNSEFNKHPVIYVDWNMAKTYCEWTGRDLPTEAQWEKAARGPDGNMYPWGNIFNGKNVNFCDVNCSFDWAYKAYNDDYADVSPVGYYPTGQSVYGALDMAGNVWEWVNDWYDVYPGGTTTSSEFGQKYRVLRGGSWFVNMHDVRSSDRYFVDLADSFNYFSGFRCSLTP